MKHRKAIAQLQARQKQYDALSEKDKQARTRPGSMSGRK